MKMKNFIKPNKRKIILSLVIFILMLGFLFPVKIIFYCKVGGDCPDPENTFLPIILHFFYGSFNFEFEDLKLVLYQYVIIELLISYLISCIITEILIKKKNKKLK